MIKASAYILFIRLNRSNLDENNRRIHPINPQDMQQSICTQIFLRTAIPET
jgi:hypothetical protein